MHPPIPHRPSFDGIRTFVRRKGQKAFPFQTAFMNGIEAKYEYPVDSQKDILRKWWTKKTKDVKKKTGDIKAFFTTTRKYRQVTS